MGKKLVDLPSELKTEILLRLPVKTLLRFRCVCKSWRSLISDHHFATSHSELASSSSRSHRLVLLEDIAYDKNLSIDLNALHDDPFALKSLRLDFLPRRSYPEIGGSCRGLLFLQSYRGFYLWNPTTGVHKKIPSPNVVHCFSNKSGFAYESSVDDYFVVLVSDKDLYQISNLINLHILSLKASKWKQIERDSHLPYMSDNSTDCPSRVGSILNGAIHWFVHNHDTSRDVIIAFDLKEKKISEIALPDDYFTNHGTIDYGLLEFGGRLSAWTVEKDEVKIWVMQEYAVDSSWTQTLVFSMHLLNVHFSLLSFTNCGNIVGAYCMGGLVIKINDKGQLLEHYSNDDPDAYLRRSHMSVYTESLLSLRGMR